MNAVHPILSDMGKAALDYARQGIPVFPCRPVAEIVNGKPKGAKSPYTTNGHDDATCDPEKVARFWTRYPQAMIGIPTGATSGLYVVDLDLDKDTTEPTGERTIGALGLSALLDGPGAFTMSGGRHLYFRHPGEGFLCTAKRIGPGVDTRGTGGYVIAPPSRGQAGQYRATGPIDWRNLPELPQALRKLLTAEKARPLHIDTGPRFTDSAPADLAEVQEIISYIPPDCGYGDWVNVLMGIHAHTGGSEAGLSLADAWSAGGTKYRRGEVAAKWRGFKPGGGVNWGTVCALARDNGADLSEIARKHRKANLASQVPPVAQVKQASTAVASPAETPVEVVAEISHDLTEDGIALAFTARFRASLRYDHDEGAWFRWTGDHWQKDVTDLAFDFARQLARQASTAAPTKDRAALGRKAFASGVEAFARADRAHAVRNDVWDRDTFRLGVPAGVVDLRTGRLLPADPADMITKRAAVAPAERADCPLWLRFLTEATNGDHDTIAFLKRWCGYCLTGDTREHALIFVHGGGGNGKSVFLNTVAGIGGDYAAKAAMETFAASKGDKHPTDLAMLRGARMVTASETEEGRAWAEARIKELTGGDTITARFMRQDFFTFTPQFKLTIVGNHAPRLANVDDAARRRFNIVPFVHKPATPDRDLERKLKDEWPGILRWMIEGALEWQAHGLQAPESVKAATADYFEEQDLIGQWLAECCTVKPANPTHFETPADLFKSWSDYARAAGEDPGKERRLGTRLRRDGLTSTVMWWNGKTQRVWQGIEILK